MLAQRKKLACLPTWLHSDVVPDGRIRRQLRMHESVLLFKMKAGPCTRSYRLDRQLLEIKSTDIGSHRLVCVHLIGAHRARTRVLKKRSNREKPEGEPKRGQAAQRQKWQWHWQ